MISTALIENPKLVIADEPTPGLDPKLAKRAMEHFRQIADMGAAVLVITQTPVVRTNDAHEDCFPLQH